MLEDPHAPDEGQTCQPAVAFYIGGDASGQHVAWSITVLTLRGDHIAAITSFLGRDHFPPFRLPASLP